MMIIATTPSTMQLNRYGLANFSGLKNKSIKILQPVLAWLCSADGVVSFCIIQLLRNFCWLRFSDLSKTTFRF